MEQIRSVFAPRKTLQCNGKLITIEKPMVMGIINVTNDSFFSGSRFRFSNSIARRAKQIIDEGGQIIDVGACSTRPGAKPVSEQEELKRLDKALAAIRKRYPETIVSVDTFRATVAKWAVKEYRVDIINDISAGQMDSKMFETIAELNVPYILMHMQGTPENMQHNPTYENVIRELVLFFNDKIEKLKQLNVKDIIIDPGFGFGKTLEHNYTILKNLETFKLLELPILAGVSRKSMIYKPLSTKPEHALNGTTVLNTYAVIKGASILRVHDVKEAVETIKLVELINAQPEFQFI
ncbi:MAG: dihydropteroate synthase [Bacteroidota bacterium]